MKYGATPKVSQTIRYHDILKHIIIKLFLNIPLIF